MQLSEIQQSLNINKRDWQELLQNIIKESNGKISCLFLDANYLYNFHLDDFEIVKKFNILGRYDIKAVKEWHKCLERWYNDQTVILADKTIKPIKISRTFDRVTNEGLEMMARSVMGSGDITSFEYRMIGDGEFAGATPGDIILVSEIDRINVNTDPEGGSLARDGTTIYSIGNHAKTIASTDVTECGMANTASPTTDLLFDHSQFEDPLSHIQNADAIGTTTIIYLCSA